ncbi:MAG TPA: xaa-pro aminopeptidase [Planctomycetes bacterium]|nr:xaa-pro aminopeptidase [Planctomycetota bacterium]
MQTPSIARSEYMQRRARVLAALKGGAAVVFAGGSSQPLLGPWIADANFQYLTGLDDEPEAAVLFDPSAEDERRRVVLFLKPLNREAERWDGYREEIGSGLRARTGFRTVMRTTSLAALLTDAARRAKRLACLHPFAVYDAAVSPDLAVYRKVAERVPGVAIEDGTELLKGMRARKSRAELAMMRRAIAATAEGYRAVVRMLAPGVNERDIQQALETSYHRHGVTRVAFNTIVGAGLNSTVLHYMANKAAAEEGDLVVIDSGASFGGYCADVTRTLPVSGRFTKEQRRFYTIVLDAQRAAIKAARPGVHMWQVEETARSVIEKAGCGDAFIHGVGHQLGLLTHDVTPAGPLAPGMVVTIEPGIYFPDRKLGIRIEDDVLIGRAGNRVLSSAVPKTIEDIESAMRKARRARGGQA